MRKDNSLDIRYRKIIFHSFLGLPGVNHLTKLSVVKSIKYLIGKKLIEFDFPKPVISTCIKFCKTLLHLLRCQMLAQLSKFLENKIRKFSEVWNLYLLTSLLTDPSPSLSMFLKTFSSGVSSPMNSPNERRPS